ncbi:ubiquitin-conjugating enzyme E2 pex4 [Ascobolus immersus RN42]|uniref:Ubiquitin-conjugating enzyme E2 2 n=1 Tax=Ascobolus immersus RN42 TaxID=1160509 RepID=A0A3N4I8T9_ASCIM|nr:ubiquitin-conjugating enzyme E2 pex4 [Ascobolus immersus RN42]
MSSASPTRRLLTELKNHTPTPELALQPSPTSLLSWTGLITGPPSTPFAPFSYHLSISIPSDYPINPPKITFLTPVFHPNVDAKTGEICLDLLKDRWTAVLTLEGCLEAIRRLLGEPGPDSPLNIEAAKLLRCGEIRGYEGVVRAWGRIYASSRGGSPQ